ncbi:MAG: HAD family hydrolase [Eubacterium sp.]|nr:HAD family hydrolase [Eubacterium sp.]
MVKLIVSDIDGTLVPDGSGAGVMNPAYFSVIRDLAARGITFVACSGRQYVSVYKVFEPVADQIFFICEGGGFVSNGNRDVLHSAAIPLDVAYELIRDARQIPQLDIMVAGIKRSYCRSADSELYRWMVNDYGFDIEAHADIDQHIDDEVLKVSLYHRNAVEALTKDSFVPKWENRVKTVLAGIQWLDCVSKESGKGSAVAFLQNHLGVTREETIVFGDNQNDIEMFAHAGVSYAVAGAREEVKQAADQICAPMEEDGVLQVLKNI